MKIAFFGDVVGKPGRRMIGQVAPSLRKDHGVDLLVANVENAAAGYGISEKIIKEMDNHGVDFYTSGNHIWDRREGIPVLEKRSNIVRPANYPGDAPGRGSTVIKVKDVPVGFIGLQGRVFMPNIDCPFHTVSRILGEMRSRCNVIIVDFHGEATSEKVAMGWFLDGKVSLLVGTHTHVPTRDARILPKGTGYVTDVGMTGSYDSVIGVEKDAVLERFLTARPVRFEVAKKDVRSDIIIAEIDEESGKTVAIDHIQRTWEG